MNVLTIDNEGFCEIGKLTSCALMNIDAGNVEKVEENSPVNGWGERFDGLRDVWKITGAAWSFVLPVEMNHPRELIA